RGRGRRDDVLVTRRALGRGVILLDDQRDLPELHDVPRAERLLAGADSDPVDVRPVGALQVANGPRVVVEADLGGPAADGTVVQNNFQRPEPAGAQERLRLPHLALDLSANPAETDRPFHEWPRGASRGACPDPARDAGIRLRANWGFAGRLRLGQF